MSDIFDKNLIRKKREKYAFTDDSYYFLVKEIYSRLLENVIGKFDLCLNLGAHRGEILPFLNSENFHVEKIIHCDLSWNMLNQIPGLKILADEENLPFKSDSFDLIVSAMYLHHTNNLPKALHSIHNSLKKDGVFIANVLGPQTLWELKKSIINAEKDTGIYPRVSPFIDVKDAGKLLQSAKFRVPVSISEIIIVNYNSVEKLFYDIKYTAQANVLIKQHHGLCTKKSFNKIIDEYNKICDGKITATFEIVTITGVK